ncbi:MAG: hypothetical protein JOY66_16250 [Acetobacteraceae bacterium]|nr:hypothetical protein [Acetobacteraceae bacterium]
MTRARIEQALLALGGLGIAGSAVGWAVSPGAFGAAWLAALLLWFAWPVGSLAWLMIHRITGGRWGGLIRPWLAVGTAATPLLLLLVVPLLLLVHAVYGWAHPDVAHTLGNTRYLNPPFFWARVGGAVVLWVLLALLALLVPARALAPPTLILLMLSVSVVAVDTTLSLEPRFNSTAFGMVIAAEWALFALSIATLATALDPLGGRVVLEQLGKLLLGVLVLWGYLAFVQFLIVWNSDLAIDAPWYVHRAEHGWGIVAYIVFAFHFAIPLCVLVWPRFQRSRPALVAVSALLVAAEVPRAWWLVLPSTGRGVGWIDGMAMLAALGLGAALMLRLPALLARRATARELRHA